jgi:lantibiotic modifying enzyme
VAIRIGERLVTAPDWLATSAAIARHVASTAYAHGGRSAWFGTTQATDDNGELAFTYGTVGADLYGGTSGIALFLAESWRRSPDALVRAHAEGAMRHALVRAYDPERLTRTGFYSGTVGVAWAALRVGEVLGIAEFADAARELLARLTDDGAAFDTSDIIDGGAGAAPVLVTMGAALGDPLLTALGQRLADQLVARATAHESGALSWAGPSDSHTGATAARHLTGFAHGAAGIGWALVEVSRRAKAPGLNSAALRAFQYEDERFVDAADNWPDYREDADGSADLRCAASWCHGAPGIGLSRLRAWEMAPSVSLRTKVDVALRCCARTIAALDATDGDGSLCHGRAGLADIALTLAHGVGDAGARDLALESMAAAATRHAADPAAWPVGVAQGSNPSLLLGLAGVGYSYLRLADPSLPSVLEPGR